MIPTYTTVSVPNFQQFWIAFWLKKKEVQKKHLLNKKKSIVTVICVRVTVKLTQKYSFLKPGIRTWAPPIWWRRSKKKSTLSMARMLSSMEFMTTFACSASSRLSACSSGVFNSRNLSNRLSSSAFLSNSLQWEGS